MRLPSFQYLEPTQVDEAVSILDTYRDQVKICAGGTEVINHLKLRLIHPATVMNIRKLPDLEGISEEAREIVIGANTTIKEISQSPLLKASASGRSRGRLSDGLSHDCRHGHPGGQYPAEYAVSDTITNRGSSCRDFRSVINGEGPSAWPSKAARAVSASIRVTWRRP